MIGEYSAHANSRGCSLRLKNNRGGNRAIKMSKLSGRILSQPLQIGSLTLSGRVFKSATSETRYTSDGYMTDSVLDFYEPLARAGTPLIITGNLFVSWQGHSSGRQGGIDNDDKIPGLRRLTDMVHGHGGRIFAQLNHGGRQVVRPQPGDNPVVSASSVQEPVLGTRPQALRRDQIPDVVAAFASAAARAQQAGFDGVQLHAAHGYLLNQFLTPHTNRRQDEYGGSLDNRMRLLREVLCAVRKRVGPDFPVIAKLNGTDSLSMRRGATDDELMQVAVMLESEGIDAIEISRGHYESFPGMCSGTYKHFIRTQITDGWGRGYTNTRKKVFWALGPVLDWGNERAAPKGEGYNLPQAARIKAVLRVPVITVGGFSKREFMEQAISSGQTDAVSCARAMIADPYLYQHLYAPEPAGPSCDFCNQCVARVGGMPADCYNTPVAARKMEMLLQHAAE